MSKARRLELLRNNLAKGSNDFRTIEEEYAFGVWVVEKEFNVGPVTEDFLLLKFWNLFDDTNIKKYKKINDKQVNTPGTLG